MQQALKRLGLNVIQARTLSFIAQNPTIIQKDLAAYLGKPDATVTNILKVLEKQDLVLRRVQPDNERQKQLFLTPAGQAAVAAVRTVFAALEGQVRACLSTAQQAVFATNLDAISRQLGQGE